jgi:hypothetical protein
VSSATRLIGKVSLALSPAGVKMRVQVPMRQYITADAGWKTDKNGPPSLGSL